MNWYDPRLLKEDAKYASLVQNNNNFEYALAQSYYVKAKQAMLQQLAADTQAKMLTTTLERTVSDLEKQIFSAANQAAADNSETLQIAKTALAEIAELASSSQSTISLKGAITKAVKQAQNTLTKEQKEYRNFSSTFTQRVRMFLSTRATETMENMLKTTKFYSGASSLVQANMRNYLLRNLVEQSLLNHKSNLSITTATSKYTQAVGGYFKEEAVVDSFNKAQQRLQSTPTGAMLPKAIDIGSQNLPSDFLFSKIINEQELSALCREHFKGVSQSQLIDPALEQSLIDSIPVFGAQIKSYSLLNANGKLTRTYFPIGARGSLRSGLIDNEKYLEGKSMAANMAYMGQRHNIITALGINNVMFIAGSKAYWMDQFIEEFRQNKLYLSLDTEGRTLDTYKVTAHVSLLKYTNSLLAQMVAKAKNKKI